MRRQLRATQEDPVQVATAESLTGGDVGGAICTVPGDPRITAAA